MKVIVACEESQVVCIAFRKRGHEAYSCDIKDCSGGHPEWHIKDDVRNHLNDGWDMMIAHPTCTRLANSGVRWLFVIPGRWEQMIQDAEFFNLMRDAPIPKICTENPIHHKYARQLIPVYTQIIQPWNFGDMESKATCLWLKGLPPLVKEITVKPDGVKQSVWKEPPSPERQANRSRTFPETARAWAEQWGEL